MSLDVPIASPTSRWKFDPDRLIRAVRLVANDHGFQDGEISLAVVDDAEIHRLNLQFLNHDWATDVISFVFDEKAPLLNGEIVVSIETAYRLAEEVDWTGQDELLLYVIHGMLHLVGMDDQDDQSACRMRDAERKYLMQLDVTGADTHGGESFLVTEPCES